MPASRGERDSGTVTPAEVSAWARDRFGIGKPRSRDRLADRFPLDPDLDPAAARAALAD